MRGEEEVKEFAAAMLATLNTEKNMAKGSWDEMTYKEIALKFWEELLETIEEKEYVDAGGGNMEAFSRELVDLANMCMMLRHWALKQVQP